MTQIESTKGGHNSAEERFNSRAKSSGTKKRQGYKHVNVERERPHLSRGKYDSKKNNRK